MTAFWAAVLVAFLSAAIIAAFKVRARRKADADSGAQDQRNADEQADTRLVEEAQKRAAELEKLSGDSLRQRASRWLRDDDRQGGGQPGGQGGG